ncbi:DsbA family protein [Candidatus Bandiella numerosa]|jgi:protein-disulfide isomerase|uniref:DsbA family protein n=1 Tax=Candidatus Bandiella numerosa TaxID=2570586 RepID=UPI00249EA194|nr:DsbA family protein [Candidatus Bandiella numerosa]WHA05079.1 DsbA family protein [Candidatus Bandiella numerosa]
MKSKNIFVLLIVLVIASLGYFFYKSSKTHPTVPDDSKTAVIDNSSKNVADDSETITKSAVKDIIKEELKDNPEIVISAIESHVSKQQDAHNKKVQQSVVDFKEQLLNDVNDPKYGTPNAKNSIVTFYDYNCGYCKKMSEVIKQIVDGKQDVYIVFKELPILGADSLKASKLAIAVYKIAPAKYLDFHFALMDDSSDSSIDQKVQNICKTLGIDNAKLYKEIEDPSVQSVIDKNLEIAKGIGFRSTPTVIVNEQLIPGYVNYDKLMSIINVNNVGNGSDVSNNANNVEVSDKNDVSSEKIDDKSQDIVDSPVSKPEQQEETSNSTNNN